MKLVFCGTPEFAVPTLEAVIAAGHEVALVVTQPDRAAGRGMEVQTPPVKQTAVERGLQVVQPEKIKNDAGFVRGWRRFGRMRLLLWRMGGLFRSGCWSCRDTGILICMDRCCRSTEALLRSSGQWRMART